MRKKVKKNNASLSQRPRSFFSRKGEPVLIAQSKEDDQPFFTPSTSRHEGLGNVPVSNPASFFHSHTQSIVQAKLEVNEPGDPFEKEADEKANQAMQKSEKPEEEETGAKNQPSQTNVIQAKCEGCEEEEKMEGQEKEKEEKEGPPQNIPLMREASGGGFTASPHLSSQLNGSKGNGTPLASGTLAFMNKTFGSDFSGVRVHTGRQAEEMSQGIGAKAFTHGSDIYFNEGKFDPGTPEGKRLLAHELVHTEQQQHGMIHKDQLDPGTAIGKSMIIPSIMITSAAPDTNSIQVSPGEQLIFNLIATDTDKRRTTAASPWVASGGTGPYEINFAATGDAEFDSSGSGTNAKKIAGLNSGNVFAFVKGTWNKTTAITIKATVTDTAAAAATAPDTGTHKDPDKVFTWNLVTRAKPCPTSLSRIAGPAAVWSPDPTDYTYRAMPDIPPAGRPDYEGQTILERFGVISALGFTMADLTDAWKAANPTLNTPDLVARFIWNSGSNGTFVFNNQDLIADRHGGFGATSPFKATAFADADGVGYRLPQEYVCGGTVVGSANIDRRFTTANGIQIRKTGP